jgi:hypothetical protein
MHIFTFGPAARTVAVPIAVLAAAAALLASNDRRQPDELADAALVSRWSELAQGNAIATDAEIPDSFLNARGWTMMYLAMHDALNAVVPAYRPYVFTETDRGAHPVAAAAQAARDVMAHVYPTRVAENGAELDYWLDRIPDGRRKARGIRLGAASAAAIVAARADDRMLEAGAYAPQDPPAPGAYRYVPPLASVYRPGFATSTPFGIRSGADFLPPPPPPLDSFAYAFSVIETRALGRRDSQFRTEDQTNLAAWWLEFNETQWGRIMRQLAETRRLRLPEATRMFALVNMANIDASVAVWYAKQHYDYWRPFHAIRLAETDGNPLTAPDAEWISEHVTPPLQEYPSGHAIQCQAIARTLRAILGTDRVSFETQSTTALPSNPVRSFTRLSSASRECGESRIMAGFHYRFSVNAGAQMGNRVAKEIVETQLLPR